MGAKLPPPCAPRGWSVIGSDCDLRNTGQEQRASSEPTAVPSLMWHPSNTSAAPSTQQMINDSQWWTTYEMNGESGNRCCGSWYRMMDTCGCLACFFKVVVQSILLSGSKMWLATPCNNQTLGGFQKMLRIWLTGKQPWRQPSGR